jgi:adenine-specific DNA methylase
VPAAVLSYSEDHVPKSQEAISIGKTLTDGRGEKNDRTYLSDMEPAFRAARGAVRPNGVGVVVFANKTTAGWEAILEAMVSAGWMVSGSWPIDTERPNRQRAIGSAALQSSVHLVCRPRESSDGALRKDDTGEWRDVLQLLPRRIHDWLPRLAEEGIVGADAIFACLGPALEIFSRFSRVERADGSTVTLREYLAEVWAAVAKEALSLLFKGADASGLEPDARLTAMWLWTLRTDRSETNGDGASGLETEDDPRNDETEDEEAASQSAKAAGYTLEFDAARKIAQGLGANLDTLKSVVEVKGQTARLRSVAEREAFLFSRHSSAAPISRSSPPAEAVPTP